MGLLDLFSSSSSSSQRFRDQSVQASDQALVYQPQNSGNVKTSVGAGGTLTINDGVSSDELRSLAESLTRQAGVNHSFDQDGSFREAVLLSLNQRAAANTARGLDEAATASPSNVRNFTLAGAAVVLVLAVLFFFKK